MSSAPVASSKELTEEFVVEEGVRVTLTLTAPREGVGGGQRKINE